MANACLSGGRGDGASLCDGRLLTLNHRTDSSLRLLLNLIALVAGFTGLIAGQPATARASAPATIAAALSGSIEQASESAAVRHLSAPAPSLFEATNAGEAVRPAFTPQTHRVDERRIE